MPALRIAWQGCEPLPAVPAPVAHEAPAGPLLPAAPPIGLWRARFRLFNDGAVPVRVESAWLPHGRFRSPGGPVTHLGPSPAPGPLPAPDPSAASDPSPGPLLIPPGGQAQLALDLAFHEQPGAVFENAFLIVVVLAGSASPAASPKGAPGPGAQRQRIFARYTVQCAPDGSPQPRLEALTAQAVGFAAGAAAGSPNPPADPGPAVDRG